MTNLKEGFCLTFFNTLPSIVLLCIPTKLSLFNGHGHGHVDHEESDTKVNQILGPFLYCILMILMHGLLFTVYVNEFKALALPISIS